MEEQEQSVPKSRPEDILETAHQRFRLAEEAEKDIRENYLEDMRFRAGEQWPEDVKRDRELDRRPCLTINRMHQAVRQVTNDQRQNRPSIKVHPVDDKADVEIAEIFQGIIRHIEQNSGADVAYDTATETTASGGIGYFRIVTAYADPMSFNQEILIKRIRNPLSVYFDPHSNEPDGSDANWCHIIEDISLEDFKQQFPDSDLCKSGDFEGVGNQRPDWVTKDTVRISEYFYKEFESVEIVQLSNGSVVRKDQLSNVIDPSMIKAKRKTKVPVVRWVKMNANEILEETIFPGPWIPVIKVIGDELEIDGKLIYEGVIRHSKDPQRTLNYYKSLEAETITLAPRSPWLVVEGQIEGYEGIWRDANRKNVAVLPVKPVSIAGQPAPMPVRNTFEPPIMALTSAGMQASDDIKATTGIYDAALGARSNEASGVAIQRRANQAQTSNFHIIDNLSRSMRHCGRILIVIIPIVYDVPQAIRTIGEDGSHKVVLINQIFEKNGEQKFYDLSRGKYDVVVQTGPSYATRRQEGAATMMELTKTSPKVMEVAGDKIISALDVPYAQDIAERLKKTLPQGLADDEGDEKPKIPPQVQAQMQQMSQMVETLTQQLNAANDDIKTKRMELESKERIENMKVQAQIEIELAKLGSKEGIELLNQEIAQIERRLGLLKQFQPIEEPDAGSMGAVMPGQEQTMAGDMPPAEGEM